jgi:hypothetical protein
MNPLSLLTLLKWGAPIALVLALFGYTYYEGVLHGEHLRDKEVADLSAEANKWHGYFNAQGQTLDNERKASEQAIIDLNNAHAAEVANLTARARAAEQRAAAVRVVVQRDLQRITPAVDARFPLSVAFVRVLQHALGEDATPATPAVAGGDQGDDAAASPVASSDAARTIASNYGECTARGEVIKQWQDWYATNKAAWEKAVQAQRNFQVVVPQ